MQPTQRSPLITAVAWCVILTFTLSALFSFLLALIFFYLIPHDQIESTVAQARAMKAIPEWGIAIIQNVQWYAAGFFAVSVFMLNSGIALLKRRDWARRVTIVILALSILAMLPGFIFRYDPATSSLPGSDQLKDTLGMMQDALIVMNALFCAIHGWLIWKLASPAIQAEFQFNAPLAKAPSETGNPSA